MRIALTLLAATVFVAAPAAAQPASLQFDFPVETGAPPRPVDPNMTVRFRHVTFEELAACGHPAPGDVTVGCIVINGNLCTVLVPPAEMITITELLHIEAHEMRHCTGQDHINEYNMNRGAPQRQLRWLP